MWDELKQSGPPSNPDPEPLPENWQAIAFSIADDLESRIRELSIFLDGIRFAVSRDDKVLFEHYLTRMREAANDRPE